MAILHTSKLGLPYPQREDTADVPRDVEALAEASDVLVPIYSGLFASRPAAGVMGRMWLATDKASGDPDRLTMDINTGWMQIAFTTGVPDRSLSHVKLILNTITIDEMGPNSVGSVNLTDGAVTNPKISTAAVKFVNIGTDLRPSQGAANGAEALRALMDPTTGIPSTGLAARGKHASQHNPSGPDPLDPLFFKPSYTTAIPTSGLFDGMEIYLAVDTTNNVIWHLRYKQSIDKWEFIGGSPKYINTLGPYTIPYAGVYNIKAHVDTGGSYITGANATVHLDINKNGTSQFGSLGSTNGNPWGQSLDANGVITCSAGDSIAGVVSISFTGTVSSSGAFMQIVPLRIG